MVLDKRKRQGFTLAELLVVMAIVGMLTLIAVPSIFRFYKDATDPVKRTAREIAQIMQVARMYAMTYHVNTAVVYGDAYIPVPITNTETNEGIIPGERFIHALISASVMYEISRKNNEGFDDIRDRLGFPASWDRIFVPIASNSEYGMNKRFEDGVILCKVEMRGKSINIGSDVFETTVPLLRSIDEGSSTADLGLAIVNVPLLDLEFSSQTFSAYTEGSGNKYSWYAHIFGPNGKLIPTSNTAVRERYVLGVVDTTHSESIIVPEGEQDKISMSDLCVTHNISFVSLYRATGRIRTEL